MSWKTLFLYQFSECKGTTFFDTDKLFKHFFFDFLKIIFNILKTNYLCLKNNLGYSSSGDFRERKSRKVAPKKPVP